MAYCHQVAAPSTFKSTPAHHVAILLPRSVNVRPFSHSRQVLQDDNPLNLLSYNPPVTLPPPVASPQNSNLTHTVIKQIIGA